MTVLKNVGMVLGILVLLLAGLAATGTLGSLLFASFVYFNGPDHEFDPALAVPAPDYADELNWAALPSKIDEADVLPIGVMPEFEQGSAPVDVLFLHPTGYLSGESWNSPMEIDSVTEENTRWMLANQASQFNGCCNVYAPRYREASIFAYLKGDAKLREQVLGFAYKDVARAFDYFIENYNEGRPFILASHSQGTHHGERLIKEKIDGTPLADNMVAAYMIGSVGKSFSKTYFDSLQNVKPCQSATQTGCVIHWDVYGDGGEESEFSMGDEPSLCTNPLSWTVTTDRIEAAMNLGALPNLGAYSIDGGDQTPSGQTFDEVQAPIANHTWAQCQDGRLYVADQSENEFFNTSIGGGAEKSYHGLDFQLFHMNVRQNVQARIERYQAQFPARAGLKSGI
jgi:hypothetical protein